MDPTICYMTLLEALREHDYARAREYALILKAWLESGGFYPHGYTVTDILDTMGRILRPACTVTAWKFPMLAITCKNCDAGDDILSLTDAIDVGWHAIDYAPEGNRYSHVGTCPECRKLEEEDR